MTRTSALTFICLSACASAYQPSPELETEHEGHVESSAPAPGVAASSPARDAQPEPATVETLAHPSNLLAPAGPDAEAHEWQLRQSLSRSSAGLKLEKRPDGASQIVLQGRFGSASVVYRDSTGKRQHMCIDTPEAADRIFGAKR